MTTKLWRSGTSSKEDGGFPQISKRFSRGYMGSVCKSTQKITFCRNNDRRNCADLGVGDYPDLNHVAGLKRNDIVGIYFNDARPEVKAYCFWNADFQGEQITYTSTQPRLSSHWANDIVSIKVVSVWDEQY